MSRWLGICRFARPLPARHTTLLSFCILGAADGGLWLSYTAIVYPALMRCPPNSCMAPFVTGLLSLAVVSAVNAGVGLLQSLRRPPCCHQHDCVAVVLGDTW